MIKVIPIVSFILKLKGKDGRFWSSQCVHHYRYSKRLGSTSLTSRKSWNLPLERYSPQGQIAASSTGCCSGSPPTVTNSEKWTYEILKVLPQLSIDNDSAKVQVHKLIFQLDPIAFPTLSQARKACRMGKVIIFEHDRGRTSLKDVESYQLYQWDCIGVYGFVGKMGQNFSID